MNYKTDNSKSSSLSEATKREIESANKRIQNINKHLIEDYHIDLFENTRSRPVVIYRKVTAWILRQYYGFSKTVIATALNRDHTTVVYYIQELNNLYSMKKNKKTGKEIIKLPLTKHISYYDEPIKYVFGIVNVCDTFLDRLDTLQIRDTFINPEYCPELYKALYKKQDISYSLLRQGDKKIYILLHIDLHDSCNNKIYQHIMRTLENMKQKDYYKSAQFIVMCFPPSGTAL